MTPHHVLLFFLFICAVILGVFGYVAVTTRAESPVDPAAAARLRRVFLIGLGGVLLGFLALTLPKMPYLAYAGVPDKVLYVTGRQSMFSIGDVPVESIEAWEDHFSKTAEVRVGETVEFQLTSLDVNHSFAVYTPEGELLAQAQVMPGYVNRLRVRFERPGSYALLCLEFCGLDHHKMRAVITVK